MGRSVAAWVAAVATVMVAGCASQSAAPPEPAPAAASEPAAVDPASVPVPPESPLAKVQKGMTMGQVAEQLGQPTDQQQYVTGKAFIPWYFGDDVSRVAWHYKGMGRVVFTGGGAFGQGGGVVEWVEYDPSETGYRK